MEKKRLANNKTLLETGFDYITGSLSVHSPYGISKLRNEQPFFPGDEEKLEEELDRVQAMMDYASSHPREVNKMLEVLCLMKDISGSVKRSLSSTLSVIELFEIKAFLLNCEALRTIMEGEGKLPDDFMLLSTDVLLDELDPKKDRINTFYIYDEFSEKLKGLREKKKVLERDIRKTQRERKDFIKKEYGIILTPKFDIVIPKSGDEAEKAKSIDMLEQIGEDYSSVTFILKPDEATYNLMEQVENINMEIEEEELVCCERLSRIVAENSQLIIDNGIKIGVIDYTLGKASFGLKHNLVRPTVVKEHVLKIDEGRHLQVEEILKSKGKTYCPITMELENGVSCITGANMGGKTISLKLAGLISIMTQYGYYVPCKDARVGLSNFIQILIGDSQSMERGLSSFGSEMEELKEILDRAKDNSLILIDEIASGTNPQEGMALTRSLVEYLKEKPYITLITTHFDTASESGIVNMQVRGLADVDFRRLNSELAGANRKTRIDIIGKYMDYRLERVSTGREVPKDALNIASMLGVPKEIIEGAREYIGKEMEGQIKGDENEE